FTYQLQQCISTSQAAFGQGSSYYSGAAVELLVADQQVAGSASFSTRPPDYRNPSGLLRMRLQNIYYTINTRLQFQQSSASGRPPPPYSPQLPIIKGTPPTTAKGGSQYFFQPTATDFTGKQDL